MPYNNAVYNAQNPWGSNFPAAFNPSNPSYVNNPNLAQPTNDALHWMGYNDPAAAFKAQGLDANGMPVAGGPNTGLWGRNYFDPTTGQNAVGATNNSYGFDPSQYVGAGAGQPTLSPTDTDFASLLGVSSSLGGGQGPGSLYDRLTQSQQYQSMFPGGQASGATNNTLGTAATAGGGAIARQIAAGADPNQIVQQYNATVNPAGQISLADVQRMQALMQQYGVTPGSVGSGVNLGGAQTPQAPPAGTPATSDPTSPGGRTGDEGWFGPQNGPVGGGQDPTGMWGSYNPATGTGTVPTPNLNEGNNYTGGMQLSQYMNPAVDFARAQSAKTLGAIYGGAGDLLSGPAAQGIADYTTNQAINQAYQPAFQNYMSDKAFNAGIDTGQQAFQYQVGLNNQQIPFNQAMQEANLGLTGGAQQATTDRLLATLLGQNAINTGAVGAAGTTGAGSGINSAITQIIAQLNGGSTLQQVMQQYPQLFNRPAGQ